MKSARKEGKTVTAAMSLPLATKESQLKGSNAFLSLSNSKFES